MPKKYLIPIIAGLIILMAAAWGYNQYQRRGAPDLSESQKEALNRQVSRADQDIANKDDKVAYYGYLDKADAFRQMGEYNQAFDVLKAAYERNKDWQGTDAFMLIEARIGAQRNTAEGIEKYESLLKKYPVDSVDYYREYISFLERTNQDPQKIVAVYKTAVAAIKDESLQKEYRAYVVDNHLPE